jgi:hypothetical protein
MSASYDTVRIETLLALALSKRSEQNDNVSAELPPPLHDLNATERRFCEALLKRYANLPKSDQERWLQHTVARARITPERNRRIDDSIHHTQIADALRKEPWQIQILILGSLTPARAQDVVGIIGAELLEKANGPAKNIISPALYDVIRQAFFAQFVPSEALNNATALDLLSGVELARLIRLLGVRETSIACSGIAAVETVTSFLKRFSAEDAYAIVSHLAVLQTVDRKRIVFAEQLARNAFIPEAEQASAMLDRTGLALLAIVLKARGTLRRRHTSQKLPLAAARELEELIDNHRFLCDRDLMRRIIDEAESLAANLHRGPVISEGDRRRRPAIAWTPEDQPT